MAEEQDKKEKPKTQLIKHRKSADEPEQREKAEKPEKKKVVVVKKKPPRKAVPKVVAKKETSKEATPSSRAAEPKSREERPKRPPTIQPSVRESKDLRPLPRRRGEPSEPPRTGGRAGYDRPPRPQGDRPAYDRGSRPQGDRGGYNRGPRPQGDRGGYNRGGQGGYDRGGRPAGPRPGGPRPGGPRSGGGRPGGPRPGGPRPGGGRPGGGYGGSSGGGAPAGNQKSGGKKFFKSKKKTNYQRRETQREKDFQIKKKSTQMTNPVPKSIDIMDVITVSDLAKKMNLKAAELIGKLMGMGMMVTMNQQIDAETAGILAGEYGCEVNIVSLYDETLIESDTGEGAEKEPRPPIVTVMGHVDHGKTKLLDAIRTTDVVAGEFGGITQHIGAYKVNLPKGGDIVFLDTPGHEAFTMMRARGAQVTDIVVLVVAANDGVMPQTKEAISHAKDAGCPIIVAVNKIDLPEANPDRVKQQLSEYDLIPEDWGGSTMFVELSALKRQGIDQLLEAILLQAEMLELSAQRDVRAEGKVIESQVDHGRGIVSTVIIQRGTLKVGDAFVAGVFPGKVRAIFNDKGQKLDEAGPSDPVEILGFTGIPDAGAPFQVTENEKMARQVGDKRQELEKQGQAANVKKITLDNLYDSIQDGEAQELKVIIKGDVQGSVEALKAALEKLSTKEIRLQVILASAGAIVESDVNFASSSNAIIVGFHVRPTPKALALADQEKVEIRKYNIIYDAVEDIRSAMEGLLAPELQEEQIGSVEVRETFKVPKIGTIAGCYVKEGVVRRGSLLRVYRDEVEIHSGKISSLKRFKDDVKEVATNYECGIGIENFDDLKPGDIFEVYEMKEVAKKLGKALSENE